MPAGGSPRSPRPKRPTPASARSPSARPSSPRVALEAERADDQVVAEQLLHLIVGAGPDQRAAELLGDVLGRRGRDGEGGKRPAVPDVCSSPAWRAGDRQLEKERTWPLLLFADRLSGLEVSG